MRYTVYDLIQDVRVKIHGAGIPQTIQQFLDEGRRNMIKRVRPPEMMREAYIEQALYPRVDVYACPEDLKYGNVTDIKVLSHYKNLDSLWRPLAQLYKRDADRKDRDNVYSVNWKNGAKLMTINHPRGLKECDHLIINECNSLTKNGTWNVGGNVVNLRLDELNHITKKASLSFDINDSSTTGFIQNFTMNPVNLIDYMNTGAAFVWVNIPIPKNMVAIKFLFGSDATDLTTDYFYQTVAHPHDNNTFMTMWNLMKYMFNALNSEGNPNPKAISWVRVEFVTNGEAIPSCNLDAINARKGEVYEMTYNSSWCLIDALTGAWKPKTTSNSDYFPFEEDTYQLLMLETALVIQKYLYANNSGAKSDITDIEDELEKSYIQYRKDHKDQFIEPEQFTQVMGRQQYGLYYQYGQRHYHRDNGWWEQGNDNGYHSDDGGDSNC